MSVSPLIPDQAVVKPKATKEKKSSVKKEKKPTPKAATPKAVKTPDTRPRFELVLSSDDDFV